MCKVATLKEIEEQGWSLNPGRYTGVADEAVDMYLKGEDKRNVKFENSEGQVYTKGKYGMLGCYGGQIFNAEIDTPTGFSKLAFLVNEQTGTEYGNSGYLN